MTQHARITVGKVARSSRKAGKALLSLTLAVLILGGNFAATLSAKAQSIVLAAPNIAAANYLGPSNLPEFSAGRVTCRLAQFQHATFATLQPFYSSVGVDDGILADIEVAYTMLAVHSCGDEGAPMDLDALEWVATQLLDLSDLLRAQASADLGVEPDEVDGALFFMGWEYARNLTACDPPSLGAIDAYVYGDREQSIDVFGHDRPGEGLVYAYTEADSPTDKDCLLETENKGGSPFGPPTPTARTQSPAVSLKPPSSPGFLACAASAIDRRPGYLRGDGCGPVGSRTNPPPPPPEEPEIDYTDIPEDPPEPDDDEPEETPPPNPDPPKAPKPQKKSPPKRSRNPGPGALDANGDGRITMGDDINGDGRVNGFDMQGGSRKAPGKSTDGLESRKGYNGRDYIIDNRGVVRW